MVAESFLLSLSRLSVCFNEVLLGADQEPFRLIVGEENGSGILDLGYRISPGRPPAELRPADMMQSRDHPDDVHFLFQSREDLDALISNDITPQELYHLGRLRIIGPEESALLATIAMARAWSGEPRR